MDERHTRFGFVHISHPDHSSNFDCKFKNGVLWRSELSPNSVAGASGTLLVAEGVTTARTVWVCHHHRSTTNRSKKMSPRTMLRPLSTNPNHHPNGCKRESILTVQTTTRDEGSHNHHHHHYDEGGEVQQKCQRTMRTMHDSSLCFVHEIMSGHETRRNENPSWPNVPQQQDITPLIKEGR